MKKCRHCSQNLDIKLIDLGFSPPSNAYLKKPDLDSMEKFFPLRVNVCKSCWLVQTEDYNNADELFDKEYAYFSSTSSSFLKHAKQYSETITNFLGLDSQSFVVEVASNDGYLLKNFVQNRIPCLGIEPTESTAIESEKVGVQTIRSFFGLSLANKISEDFQQADLIIGNNVYAHVPDINDFTAGLHKLLKNDGVITLEFPHFLELFRNNQFDTIYHEHYSYLSLKTVSKIFSSHGLRIFNVEQLKTHGGSLRIYGCHHDADFKDSDLVFNIQREEEKFKLFEEATYKSFQEKAISIKNDLIKFLIEQREAGKKVIAYGAAAKGNTLLNFAGIKRDLIEFVCDAAPSKQNKYLPGSHIPILSTEALTEEEYDFILILPWNLADEITANLKGKISENVKYITAIPSLRVFN